MRTEDAREYSEALGMIGAGWWRQVAWAHQQGIPRALGLSTREWVTAYIGGFQRLAIENRREAVLELVAPPENGGMGLSRRAAGDVLGVDHETVRRDIGAIAPVEAEAERDAGVNAPAEVAAVPPSPEPDDEEVSIEHEYDHLMRAMRDVVALRGTVEPIRANWTPEQRERMQKRAEQMIRVGQRIAMRQM